MIVLKKLLAFAIAISIATPATSLAQTPVQAPPPVRARKKDAKRAAAATRPARATRKVAARPLRGHRGLASVDETPSTPFKNPPAKIVKFGNKSYVYAERYTPRGRLLSTLYVGQNFREIKVDEFGTGTASKWDITKNDTTMRASKPYRGHFMQLEFEQRRAKDRLFLELSYVPRIKRYHLDRSYVKKYAVLHSDSVVFGDTCSLSNVQSLDDFRKIVDQLNGADTSGDALACHLRAEAPLLFDKSCTDPGSPMKDSIGDITKGLSDIMESGPVKDSTSKNGYGSSTSGTYLSCLEQHGMAEHSSLIQGELNDVLKRAQDQIDLALFRRVITQAQHDEILNPKSPNCDMDPDVMTKIKTQVSNNGNGGKPLFSCAAAPGTNRADVGEYRGNFVSGNNYNQIFLPVPKGQMPSAVPWAGQTSESAYASTLLHEFVHSSGIDDENLTLNSEKCCAGADEATRTKACKDLDTRLVGSANSYEAENRFGGVMGSGSFKTSSAKVTDYMNKKLNSGDDSQELLKRYQQYVGAKVEADSVAHANLKDQDGTTVCSLTAPDDFCLQEQINFSKTNLVKYTDQFLTDQCPIVLQGQNREDTSFCGNGKLKKELEGYVTYVPTAPSQTGITVAALPGDSSTPAADQSPNPSQKTDPYADLYSVQQGEVGTITNDPGNVTKTTGNGATTNPPVDASSIAMGPKAVIRMAAPITGNPNEPGSASNIVAGAVTGQAGVGSSSRPDGLDGSKPSEALGDTLDKTATAVGNAASSTANADDNQEIVVTARRQPKAQQTDNDSSSYSPPSSSIPWMPTAAPVVSRGSTDSGRSVASPSTAMPSFSSGGSPGVYGGSSSSGPQDLGAEMQQAVPAGAPVAYGQASGVPVVGSAGGSSAAGGSAYAATAGGASGVGSDNGGGGRSPSAIAPASDKAATTSRSGAGTPTFTRVEQLDNWLSLDYSRIQDRLQSTPVKAQLIKFHTEVVGPDGGTIGCTLPRCQCERVFNYSQPQNRLLPAGRTCK